MRTIVQSPDVLPFDDDFEATVYACDPEETVRLRREETSSCKEETDRVQRHQRARLFQSSGHTEHNSSAANEDPGVACSACAKQFTSQAALARHLTNFTVCRRWIDTAHASRAQPLDLSTLRAHPGVTGSYLAEVLAGGSSALDTRSCECCACGRAFSSTSALNRHFRSSLVCDRWRASELLDKLAACAQRVAHVQSADQARGQQWESARPDIANDVLSRAGV